MQYVKKDGKHTTLLGTDFWQNFSVDDPSPADSTQMIPETEARKKHFLYAHTRRRLNHVFVFKKSEYCGCTNSAQQIKKVAWVNRLAIVNLFLEFGNDFVDAKMHTYGIDNKVNK